MQLLDISQDQLDELFMSICESGDVEQLREIYQKYPPKISLQESTFNLRFYNKKKIFLDVHFDYDRGFQTACENGHENIVDFLLAIPNFSEEGNKVGRINYAFGQSLKSGHLHISKKLLHLVDTDNEVLKENIYIGFWNACNNGSLDVVKFILTEKKLNINCYNFLNDNHGQYLRGEAFSAACESSHPHIVKYLTSSPEIKDHMDLNAVDEIVTITNMEIINHLVCDLNITKEDRIFTRFDPATKIVVEEIIRNRNMYHQLNDTLQANTQPPTSIVKKHKL